MLIRSRKFRSLLAAVAFYFFHEGHAVFTPGYHKHMQLFPVFDNNVFDRLEYMYLRYRHPGSRSYMCRKLCRRPYSRNAMKSKIIPLKKEGVMYITIQKKRYLLQRNTRGRLDAGWNVPKQKKK